MLKYCAVLSLCAGLALCQSGYITGQAARLIIGQTTFTSQNFIGDNNPVLQPNQELGSVGGVAYAANTLFVADSNRLGLLPIMNRVVMYTNINQAWPAATAAIPAYSGRCPVCVNAAQMVLGQPDFKSASNLPNRTQNGMNLPLAVASDGVHFAVADTANNRILLWNEIPSTNNQNADLVLGQPDFTTFNLPSPVSASNMRAPQGVYFSNGKLMVADTQNNRVLIWNTVPTKNNQPADLVLGAPNFTTVPNADQTSNTVVATASTLLSPTSVTSDGVHLFVADLGFSRVLIWLTFPTTNDQAADVEVGQHDMFTGLENDVSDLCASNGTDINGNPTYPALCGKTMDFPRFALSDGTRLYVADSGNDRVLVWNTIPTRNAQQPDVILGEPDEFTDSVTSNNSLFAPDLAASASNVTPTPTALAWDGTNLYVTDPSDFRILVFTPESPSVLENGVVNSASLAIYALGTVAITGTITPGDVITVTINGFNYTYTVVTNDTAETVVAGLVTAINTTNNGKGDPNVIARQPGRLRRVTAYRARIGHGRQFHHSFGCCVHRCHRNGLRQRRAARRRRQRLHACAGNHHRHPGDQSGRPAHGNQSQRAEPATRSGRRRSVCGWHPLADHVCFVYADQRADSLRSDRRQLQQPVRTDHPCRWIGHHCRRGGPAHHTRESRHLRQ